MLRPASSDLAFLAHLGLKQVCDLRSPEEVASGPDHLPQNPVPEYHHIPVQAGSQTRQRINALLFNTQSLDDLMIEAYTGVMIGQNGPVFGQVLRAIADPARLPLAVHCTVGKDRTGVAIALLLALLDVPDEVIIADYSLSNLYYDSARDFVASQFRQPQAFLFALQVDDFQPLISAPPQTMRRTLNYIRETYGSVENYLRQQAELNSDVIDSLKTNLLT